MVKVAILTVGNKGIAGKGDVSSCKVVREMIKKFNGEEVYCNMLSDEFRGIEEELFHISERNIADLVLTTGGTGFAREDITPEATLTVIEKETPGITDLMRQKILDTNPEIALSRNRAGIRKSTLIINLPDIPVLIKECLEAIVPIIPHAIEILKGNMDGNEVKLKLW